jgi:hypothetical protein
VAGARHFNSGYLVRSGTLIAGSNCRIPNPTPARWFDTSKFLKEPPRTPRGKRCQQHDLSSTSLWDLHGTLSKMFRLTEKMGSRLNITALTAPTPTPGPSARISA